jgi:hypothetical protein
MINPPHPSELPQLTLAERDRRWGRVRDAMRRERMDLIISPPHTGQQYRRHGPGHRSRLRKVP